MKKQNISFNFRFENGIYYISDLKKAKLFKFISESNISLLKLKVVKNITIKNNIKTYNISFKYKQFKKLKKLMLKYESKSRIFFYQVPNLDTVSGGETYKFMKVFNLEPLSPLYWFNGYLDNDHYHEKTIALLHKVLDRSTNHKVILGKLNKTLSKEDLKSKIKIEISQRKAFLHNLNVGSRTHK